MLGSCAANIAHAALTSKPSPLSACATPPKNELYRRTESNSAHAEKMWDMLEPASWIVSLSREETWLDAWWGTSVPPASIQCEPSLGRYTDGFAFSTASNGMRSNVS